ncbi:Major Facilitator Superfamily protein [Planifilum fulgidum]|jgi:MFS family permease|uniref:Major Facilitator Superfamily protein n=1 Tax=Planifilum fulgidum TaxID=201973 RepID=A0A1I2T2E5_9BACL|nr:MFS transporter [Planifilum fulgidum]SFG56576.1 Major Facilitator Superfamily protein [Planifilum fulgidum]
MPRRRGPAQPFVIAIIVIALDVALMAPLLRTLSEDFGITHRWSAWVIALYLAVFSFALPFAESRMRGIDGRRLFSVSLLLLAIGSAVGALAPAWLVLLGGRTLQALGASGVVPALSQGLRHSRRPVLVRVIGGLLSVLLIIAPLLSAFLNGRWGWRWVFVAFLPVILLLHLIARRLPASSFSRHKRLESGSAFFFLGSLLFAMIAVTRMEPLSGLKVMLHPEVLPYWILSVGLIVPLIMVEKRVEHPLFIPKAANRSFVLVQLTAAISGMCLMVFVIIPGWITPLFPDALGIGGIGLAVVAAAVGGVLPLARRIADRWGSRVALSAGLFALSLASFVLGVSRDFTVLAFALLLLGGGIGLTVSAPLHDLLFGRLPLRRVRTGLVVLGMFRAAGGALGLLLITRLIDERNFQAGEALMMVTAVALAGAFLALRLPGGPAGRGRR